MANHRAQILEWIETGFIPADKTDDALHSAGVLPSAQDWRQFINLLLLWSGTAACATSVIFFFAFNWEEMHRFTKFALVEVLLIAALIGYWRLASNSLYGKALLMSAALLLGALLALFGQTYQTGADPWQLFAFWALVILPWAAVGQFPALWLLWLGLINLSLALYFTVHRGIWGLFFNIETQMLLAFAVNTAALLLWEWMARRHAWLAERWAIRVVALGSGFCITFVMLQAILDWRNTSTWSALLYPAWMAVFYWIYRRRIEDLFMLAGAALSLIVVITALLARALLDHADAGGFLFIALAVIGMSAAAAVWLKRIHMEREA